MLRQLKQCAAQLSLLSALVSSNAGTASADITLSFPNTQVTPGVFTAPVLVSSLTSSSVNSINPSIEVSLLSGPAGSILITGYSPPNGVAPLGTIWAGESVSTGINSPPSLPSAVAKFSFSVANPVLANGTVVLLTFDATSAAIGSVFEVNLNFNNLTTASDAGGPLPSNEKTFLAGTISVVPEPSAWLLMAVSTVSGLIARKLTRFRLR